MMTVADVLAQAQAAHRAGRLTEAGALYERVLANDANHAGALYLLGLVFAQIGQPAAAVDLMRRAAVVDPQSPELHHNLGTALREAGQLEAAVVQYRRAIELRPDYASAHSNLASSLWAAGRLEEAQ